MVKSHGRANALRAGAIAAIAGLLLAGCAKASSDARPVPGKPVATTRTPAVQPVEALAAYRAMWDDLAAAAETSDAKHPGLGAHASGGALQLLRHMMTEDRKKEVVTKGQLRLGPVVEDNGMMRVVIRDCADATDWLHYTTDGKPENDVPGGHHRIDATLFQRGGGWWVDRLSIGQVGSC